ncbi:MAG: hypothetical protein GXO74_08470 [Calditrichaeota bacterium]|nr:hypothetical protein [Calditrichota bacterium]
MPPPPPPEPPFNYVAFPTDQMGMLYNPDGTEITPEGFLYTGYGELMFFAGNQLRPINQPIRTLHKGYLPVFNYSVWRNGFKYEFTTFATTLDDNLEQALVNYIRVKISNFTYKKQTGYFATAFRYSNEDNSHRFRRPRVPKYPGAHSHSGVKFNPTWKFKFDHNFLYRSDSLMLIFPEKFPGKSVSVKKSAKKPDAEITPTTPMGRVEYKFKLKPHESLDLDFLMPYRPLPRGSDNIKALMRKNFDEEKDKVAAFWEKLVNQGMTISLPEEKVVNTFNANLIYDLMALDKVGENYIQTVNLFHYHAFWLRDGSFVVRNYDVTGYHDIAEKCLDFFLRWQQEDGNFVSQGGQFDGWGQTLWAFGQHAEMTGDLKFARKVFPAVVRAVDWLKQARGKDEFHLMPQTRPGDNEQITGHVTGHNFWALLGLKKAILLAGMLGEEKKKAEFEAEYADFYSALRKRLTEITAISGGYIPPGLDDLSGYDWGNLLSVFPEPILDPWEPMVSATQAAARAKFREGLMTYADQKYIHNYLTTNVTQTSLIRGEQRDVLHDFYSLLLHTTSTHAGFEYSVLPWKDRDVHGNLTPHGWFAAKFRMLLHDMLVRDENEELHLFSAVSPEWLKTGVPISVKNGASKFGKIDFKMIPDDSGAVVTWRANFRQQPGAIVIHIPFFATLKSIELSGKKYSLAKDFGLNKTNLPKLGADRVVVPPTANKIRLNWKINSPSDEFSYDYFVEKYKLEYQFHLRRK